jgi:uncharacterized iron-regulated protein
MDNSRNSHVLTDLQRAFVADFVATGGKNATASARSAGYSADSARQEGWRLLRKPSIQTAIQRERARAIDTEGATRAWAVIEGILDDVKVPYGIRFEAAKYVMSIAGHVPPREKTEDGSRDKPIEEMTVSELESLIRRHERAEEPAVGSSDASATETSEVEPSPSENDEKPAQAAA